VSVHNYVRLKIAYGYMVKLASTAVLNLVVLCCWLASLAQLYSCTRTAAPSILNLVYVLNLVQCMYILHVVDTSLEVGW